jgi:phosphotransferase system HPr (HPr) family protein
MNTIRLVINDPVGLHARPASRFVETANCFEAEMRMCNRAAPEEWVNAKSILGVLTCAVKQGDEIEVQAEGADEEAALEALENLVKSGFKDEPEENEGESVTA